MGDVFTCGACVCMSVYVSMYIYVCLCMHVYINMIYVYGYKCVGYLCDWTFMQISSMSTSPGQDIK